MDGALSSVDWRTVTRTGARATVVVRVAQWTLRHGGSGGGGTPTPYRLDSTWDWTMTLEHDTGSWLVSTLDLDCLSGCP